MADENIEKPSFVGSVVQEIVNSPLNLALIGVITFLVYKIIKSRYQKNEVVEPEPELPRLRCDFTVQDLKQHDGNGPDGRVLVAVNGNVYDVTKGKRFYGPGGPYAAFGGRDASRGLATFSVTSSEKEYDDLSDLNSMEMESVREWEMQFKEKYILVGRLLKPGEQPTSYSDEDEDTANDSTSIDQEKDEEKEAVQELEKEKDKVEETKKPEGTKKEEKIEDKVENIESTVDEKTEEKPKAE